MVNDEKNVYHLGAECLEDGFLVDDCFYGADSTEEALEIQSHTLSILKAVGLHLRKWSSSCFQKLEAVPESDRETNTLLDNKMSVKTLGIQWNKVM